jgi:hypothetical protein
VTRIRCTTLGSAPAPSHRVAHVWRRSAPPCGQCRYVRQWMTVKTRWHLSVDAAEKRSLTARAASARLAH